MIKNFRNKIFKKINEDIFINYKWEYPNLVVSKPIRRVDRVIDIPLYSSNDGKIPILENIEKIINYKDYIRKIEVIRVKNGYDDYKE